MMQQDSNSSTSATTTNLKSLSPGSMLGEWGVTASSTSTTVGANNNHHQQISNDFSSIFSSGNTTPSHQLHHNAHNLHQQQQQVNNNLHMFGSGNGGSGNNSTSLLTTTATTSSSSLHHHNNNNPHHNPHLHHSHHNRSVSSSGSTPTQALPHISGGFPSSAASSTTSSSVTGTHQHHNNNNFRLMNNNGGGGTSNNNHLTYPPPPNSASSSAGYNNNNHHQQQQHHNNNSNNNNHHHYNNNNNGYGTIHNNIHSSLHHHNPNGQQYHNNNGNGLAGGGGGHHHYRNNNENIEGVACIGYTELTTQKVDHLGRCTISDIRAEAFSENECYHSEIQRDTIVTAIAHVHQTNTRHKIQRIMVGQLWMDFVRDAGLTDGHSVGRLMSFIANEPVTIFGMIPNDALKNGQSKTVPTMVGFWLSIDSKDHPEGLLDLQRASILFSRKGLLAAFTPAEHRRLLEIADLRRCAGNTGLPESPMTLEAAKNPPKRQATDGKEVDVFRYHPPVNHRWPQTRGGFHPFVTRWEMSVKDDEGRFSADKSFALVATDMKNLKPWGKRVISKLKMVRRNDSDDDIPVHSLNEEEQYE